MDICEEKVVSRWTMKQEIIDDLENYDEVTDDTIREICDSLVPVYNSELIDHCASLFREGILGHLAHERNGRRDPLDIIRGNLFVLYLQIGQEVLTEREEENV